MIKTVSFENGSYNIILARGCFSRAEEYFDLKRSVFIVTDSQVPCSYSEELAKKCDKAFIHVIPDGENSKSFEQLQKLLSAMLSAGLTRSDCLVAIGGGVVGDLSGFAASIYMRGLDFYNIPTSLLAQVDSSIGGKTAIDLNGVKNAVGSFYQPKAVIVDTDMLKTLAPRQLYAGLAECIKMSLTSDRELFELIENGRLEENIEEIISRSLDIKISVVQQDPNEKGLRKVLNFGHTIGHAIESAESGRYLHGECVGLGMLPLCPPELRLRLEGVLSKYGLPIKIEKSADELMPYIVHDKKSSGNMLTLVKVDSPGSFYFEKLSFDEIKAIITEN